MTTNPKGENSAGLPALAWERLTCCLAVYAVFLGGYAWLNRSIPESRCWDFTTRLDRATPFLPAFIWPFYLAYVAPLVPCVRAPDRPALLRVTEAFLALILVSFALFLLVPVTVPRPQNLPDSWSGRLVQLQYQHDRPVCAFPSLHVSTMVLATAALFRMGRADGWRFLPLTVCASVATLFVKQHGIADVAGGVALALVVDSLVQAKPRSQACAPPAGPS